MVIQAQTEFSGFNEMKHVALAQMLKGIKGKFVLSYNDSEFIRSLYKAFNIHEVQRHSNLASRYGEGKTYKELIITNY